MKTKLLQTLNIAVLLTSGLYNHAQAEQPQPQMTVYSEIVGADEILKGEYELALKKMAALSRGNPMMRYNNLCVAYTLSHQLDKAKISCERAIEESARRKNHGVTWLERTKTPRLIRQYKSRARNHLMILNEAQEQLVKQ